MSTFNPFRILIADDDVNCLQALQLALKDRRRITICGVAPGGRQLIELAGSLQPDVIITDIRMPGTNGIEATRLIKEQHPHQKILALTQYRDQGLILEMARAGADGYLMKNAEGEVLEAAIDTVMNNIPFFCDATTVVLQRMLREGMLPGSFKPLPPKFFATNEKEILVLMCRGLATKQIAAALSLSQHTVSKYRQNLMDKTGMQNDVALAMFAVLHGVYTPE